MDPNPHEVEAEAFRATIPNRYLLRDEVYGWIRDAIIAGRFAPGERLRDIELAEQLQVSRTPVREALRRLEDERLVQTEANRWTRVAPLDESEADRIYPIIWTLESLALQLAAPNFTDQVLDSMVAANAELVAALEAGDPVAASASDYRFHQVMIQASGNDDLIRLLRDLKVRLRRFEVAYFQGSATVAASVREHEKIISDLKRRDFEGAAAKTRSNWAESLERVKATVRRAGEPAGRVVPEDAA